MKTVFKNVLAIVILSIVAQNSFAQSGVSVDHIDHLRDGKMAVDIPTSFFIRFNNDSALYGAPIHGFSFGFKFYITNNGLIPTGVFQPVTNEIINSQNWISYFTLVPVQIENFAVDGIDVDTVGIRGVESFLSPPSTEFSSLDGGGLPIDYDDIVLRLETAALGAHIGDTLCIDSSRFSPGNFWHWHLEGNIRFEDVPWTGPHCFEIVEKCCVGIRGNVDVSTDEVVDISDLVMLVDFMFTEGLEPYCNEESNVDGDIEGLVDISDLVMLVDFMFTSGPPPVACP